MDDRAAATERESPERCYAHPREITGLHCTRCGRPICARCAIPASVGQHCPDCYAADRRSMRKARPAAAVRAPVTLVLIGINVAMFLAQQAVPGFTTSLWASTPAIASGEWYRLITSAFLHAGVWHILLNMIALYYFGPPAEEAFGRLRFLALYLVSGYLAAVTSYWLEPIGVPSLGASGAIFGLFGAVIVLAYKRRHAAAGGAMLRSLAWLLALNLVIGVVVPHIDLWAHLGGLVAGAILGFLYDRSSAPASAALQVLGTLALVAAGVALTVVRGDVVRAAETAHLSGAGLALGVIVMSRLRPRPHRSDQGEHGDPPQRQR